MLSFHTYKLYSANRQRKKRHLPRFLDVPLSHAKSSAYIPPGGWTMQSFRTEEGKTLVKNYLAIHRRALKLNTPKVRKEIGRLIDESVERAISIIESKLPRTKALPSMQVTTFNVGAYEHLWADAIQREFDSLGEKVSVSLMEPMTSAAELTTERQSLLLGLSSKDKIANAKRRIGVSLRGIAADDGSRIADTTMRKLRYALNKAAEKGTDAESVIGKLREIAPQISKSRMMTIAKTQIGRSVDMATCIEAEESGIVTHMSVIGCETIDPKPTFEGRPTCNIRNVPVARCKEVRFHPNHTGTWVPSGFVMEDGSEPELAMGSGNGFGTWDEQISSGEPRPFMNEEYDPMQDSPADPFFPIKATDVGAPAYIRPRQGTVIHAPSSIDMEDFPALWDGDNDECKSLLKTMKEGIDTKIVQIKSNATAYNLSRSSGLSIDEIHKTLGESVSSSGLQSKLRFLQDNTIELIGIDAAENVVLRAKRKFEYNLDGHAAVVHHKHMRMTSSVQNNGLGRKVFSSMLSLYDQMGVDKIAIHAGLDVGGYAWARYGFLPSQGSWDRLRNKCVGRINQLVESGAIDTMRHSDAIVGAYDSIMQTDPFAIRKLAALDEGITFDGKSMTLGKAMLTGMDWFGFLRLNRMTDYAILKAYIDGNMKKEMTDDIGMLDSVYGNLRADIEAMRHCIMNGSTMVEAMVLCCSPANAEMIGRIYAGEYVEYGKIRFGNIDSLKR